MIKKIFCFLVSLSFCVRVAAAAQMVNVEYIHSAIEKEWGINIPYNPALENPHVAANVKYLLTAVDRANQLLNGLQITDYGNGEYATMAAVDTVATQDAVKRLIERKNGFIMVTTPTADSFSLRMSAKGNFVVDWGDGQVQQITRDSLTSQEYSHTYATPGRYVIVLSGRATGYYDFHVTGLTPSDDTTTITFKGNKNIAAIAGSLGQIFPTVDGTVPIFANLFYNCSNLTGNIPENLFDGLVTTADNVPSYMFANAFKASGFTGTIPENLFAGVNGTFQGVFEGTFYGARGLTGSIPANLFANVKGNTYHVIFNQTFRDCTGLTGSIPGELFAGVSGKPMDALFFKTFGGCTGLTGSIPGNLFANIHGAPGESSFAELFMGDRRLSGRIPGELFAGVEGKPSIQMFHSTFAGCRGLQGPIPANLFAGIKGAPAGAMFAQTFMQTPLGNGGIPENLFAGIEGAPAPQMFMGTFMDASVSAIPEKLFAGIKGAPAYDMFRNTFHWNYGLKTLPAGLLAGIEGAPAAGMYNSMFSSCPALTSVPDGFFGKISGAYAGGMFASTFDGDSALSGPSPRDENGVPLYQIWTVPSDQNTYKGCSKLDDWAEIPDYWK